MVIVVVKDYREAGGLDTKKLEPRTGKRPRAQPPGGWVGESSAVKKRSVGERMEKMTKLLQKNATKEDEVKHERKHSNKRNRRSRSKDSDKNGSQINSAAPSRKESIDEGADSGRDKKVEISAKEKEKEVEDWRASLKQMLDEIKKVKELPQVIVPETLAKAKQKKSISMSMPDVSSTKKSGFSLTYADIKLKHLNRRTKEIVHNAKPSEKLENESIRVSATADQNGEKTFSFSENKTNVVTDVAFVGSSYVGKKELIASKTLPRSSSQLDCKTGEHKNTNTQTKSTYKVHMDLKKIKIIDQMKPPSERESNNKLDYLEKLLMFNRIPQLLMLKCENWEPEPVTGGCEPMQTETSDDMDTISPESPMIIDNQNSNFMSTILEDENEVKESLITEVAEVAEPVEPGHIGKKMHGAIADMDIVCVRKRQDVPITPGPGPKQPKPAKKVSSGAKAVDWREEVKKREKEKQVAKLNAMPLGMPDYKEPEKCAVVDWRDAVAKQAEDNSNPLNKWKAFTKTNLHLQKPMPKKEEIVCSCLKGNCKLHVKVQPKWKAVTKRKDDDNKDEQPKKAKSTENLVKSKSVSSSKENLSKSSQVFLNDQHSPSKESLNDAQDTIATIANEQTKVVSRSKENLSSIANKENKATEIENLVLQKLNAQCISEAEPPVTKLKRTGSIKKKPLQPIQKVEKEKAPILKTVEQQDRPARAPSVSKETIKIINFVAIKVGVEESPPAPKAKRKTLVKKQPAPYSCHHMGACGCIPPPPKIKPPPPPPPSPPPPPKEPTPPPPTPPPTPPPPPPPPKEPTPPPPPTPTIRQIVKAPQSPPLPSRKYFDNPEPIKPRPFSFHDNTPVYCKQKRVEDISVAPITRKRWSTDVETKPLKFSTFGDNCIKSALFLGDSYVGGSSNDQSPQNGSFKQESSEKTSTQQNSDKRSSKGSIYTQYSSTAKSNMENENEINEHSGDSKYKKLKENGTVPNSIKIENVENGVVRRDDVSKTSPKLNCDNKRNRAKLKITGAPQVNGSSWRTKFHNDLKNDEKEKDAEKRKTWNDYIWEGSRNKNEDNPPKGPKEHRSIKEYIGLLSPTVTSPLSSTFPSPYASKKTTPCSSKFNSPQGSPESPRKNYLNVDSPRKSSRRKNSATSIVGILNKLAEKASPPTSKKPWAQENKSNEKKKV